MAYHHLNIVIKNGSNNRLLSLIVPAASINETEEKVRDVARSYTTTLSY